jgi:hypothetical protein
MRDIINPYESSDSAAASQAQTSSAVPRVLALLIAVLAPIPTTAVCFLLIVMSANCKTDACRQAHTIIGGTCGFIPILPLTLIAALTHRHYCLFATFAGFVLWTLAASLFYYSIMA